MIKFNGLILAVTYCLSAWIMGYVGWKVYTRKQEQGLVRSRDSEIVGPYGHYVFMIFHVLIGLGFGWIFWLVSGPVPFLDGVKKYLVMIVGVIVGSVAGYILERPSRNEHVDYSDYI